MPDKSRKYAYQAAQTLNTIAYYALPDVVRSNAMRKLLRTGIIGAMIYNEFKNWPLEPIEPIEEVPTKDSGDYFTNEDYEANSAQGPVAKLAEQVSENPALGAALAGVVATGAIALTVSAERAIFRRGERKRAAGDRCAHLKQGLAMGALNQAVITLIDALDKEDAD